MKYIIRLSYNGSAFSGWQIQPNDPSVQKSIQKALSTLLNEDISVTGAGRTDTSVNAINYIAHFETHSAIAFEAEALRYKLNAITPAEIAVHEVSPVDENFHARFDATSREYKYFIHRKKDPFISKFSCFHPRNLDLQAMNSATEYLIGTHDFSCFEKVGGNNKTSICTVSEAHWDFWKPDHVVMMNYPYTEGDYIVFTIRADRFLRNMVRAVVGSMLEIGQGKRSPEWLGELISCGTRSDAGQSVPGYPLFLCDVRYEGKDSGSDSAEKPL